jgi:hypothetical protein
MAGFAPAFDSVGRRLDAAISEPNLGSYFSADSTQIVVAIADVKWRDTVLFSAYRVKDIDLITNQARAEIAGTVAVCESVGFPAEQLDRIAPLWLKWARRARKGVRTGAVMREASPDLQIGSLLACIPHVRGELQEITDRGGAIPMLAIALDSPNAIHDRRKFQLRAVTFGLSRWALTAGPVAGNA